MIDLSQTSLKILTLIYKYNGDHDTMPGLPPVTKSDFDILNILLDMMIHFQQLEEKIATLHSAQYVTTHTEDIRPRHEQPKIPKHGCIF